MPAGAETLLPQHEVERPRLVGEQPYVLGIGADAALAGRHGVEPRREAAEAVRPAPVVTTELVCPSRLRHLHRGSRHCRALVGMYVARERDVRVGVERQR